MNINYTSRKLAKYVLKLLSTGVILAVYGVASTAYAGNFEGNQLYVSISDGDDSVSRSNNSISRPWKTLAKALQTAQAGDVVNFRAGTYNVSNDIYTLNEGNAGTAQNRIIFTNYQSEYVLVKDTGGRVFIDQPYWTFSGINADSSGRLFTIGDQGGGDNAIFEHGIFRQLTEGGAANDAPIYFVAGGGDNSIVRNSRFIGPGAGGNENTAGVFAFRTKGLKILNNEFSGLPGGVYYKHPGVGYDTGIEIAYNYFHDNNKPIGTAMIRAYIHDNLVVGGSLFLGNGAGAGDDGNNHGGDYNNIVHNTLYNAYFRLIGLDASEGYGATNNILRNNIVTNLSHLIPYKNLNHNTTMDYNLYPTGDMILNNGKYYTLAEWKAFYGQDANSIAGQPVFVGGATPSAVADFALAPSSPGYKAASDGLDMGANMSLVGTGQMGMARPNPPSQFIQKKL